MSETFRARQSPQLELLCSSALWSVLQHHCTGSHAATAGGGARGGNTMSCCCQKLLLSERAALRQAGGSSVRGQSFSADCKGSPVEAPAELRPGVHLNYGLALQSRASSQSQSPVLGLLLTQLRSAHVPCTPPSLPGHRKPCSLAHEHSRAQTEPCITRSLLCQLWGSRGG